MLILYPNLQNCTGKYLLPFFGGWERWYSSIPLVLSPAHVSNHSGGFPNFMLPDIIWGDPGSDEWNMTHLEAGQPGHLELHIEKPVAREPTKNTECSGTGVGISRAVDKSKYKSMCWDPRDLGLNSRSATYCVILHKLLNLSERTLFIDKMRTDLMRLMEEWNWHNSCDTLGTEPCI